MDKRKDADPPKYKVGDMVYSWQNPDERKPVFKVHIEEDPDYQHTYKLDLTDEVGYSKRSKWMDEMSLVVNKEEL